MKKIFVILMAALLTCSLVACGNNDKIVLSDNNKVEDKLVYKNFVYTINEEGTYEIVGFDGTTPEAIEIPSKIGEVEVTGIGDNAFMNQPMKTVSIPDTVEYIGISAFRDCDELTAVQIPDSVKEIGVAAFYDCAKLTTVKLPAGLKKIEMVTFKNCKVLTGIVLPEGLETIEDAAFWGCKSLTEITIPTTVKDMGDAAFYECEGLKKATVLGSALGNVEIVVDENGKEHDVEHFIGEIVFNGCPDLAIEWTEGTIFAEYAKANDYKAYKAPVETNAQ